MNLIPKLCHEIGTILATKDYDLITAKVKLVLLGSKFRTIQKLNEDAIQAMLNESDEAHMEMESLYCDNSRNFACASYVLNAIDWDEIISTAS